MVDLDQLTPLTIGNTAATASTHYVDKSLHAFPPEARDMISLEVLPGSWNGETPALIKALRRSKD
jgi:hypothetical protein